MEVVNNSTIETVIDFANVKFGMELTKDQVSEQLRNLSFSQTLKLINSMKADDNDAFSEIIDLSAVSEGWSVLPSIDREKYQERDGLEGPIQTKIGKTLYYDPKEGKYYDPDSDMYIDYDTFKMYDSKENSYWNVDNEDKINEAFVLAPWILPALATAVRVGAPALKLLLKGGKKAAPTVKNTTTNMIQKSTASGVIVGAVGKTVYDKVGDAIDGIKKIFSIDMDEDTLNIFAQIVVKYGIPMAAIGAVLYGGKQLKDYMASQEQDGEAIPETQLDEYGTINTAQPSRATINAQNSNVANRRYNITVQDQNRDSNVPNRTVAGGNKQPTGQGAVRAGSADPDDIERANNANVSAQNQQQANINAQEIERLKQLALGK